jgi:hypothetical protein
MSRKRQIFVMTFLQNRVKAGQKCYYVIEFICFLFVNTLSNICKCVVDHLMERLPAVPWCITGRLLGSPFSNKQSNSGGSI